MAIKIKRVEEVEVLWHVPDGGLVASAMIRGGELEIWPNNISYIFHYALNAPDEFYEFLKAIKANLKS